MQREWEGWKLGLGLCTTLSISDSITAHILLAPQSGAHQDHQDQDQISGATYISDVVF